MKQRRVRQVMVRPIEDIPPPRIVTGASAPLPAGEEDPSFDVYVLREGSLANRADLRVGMGFVIGPRHVLTCAHVVASCLGNEEFWLDRNTRPEAKIPLAFAYSERHPDPVVTTIAGWWPARSEVHNKGLDDVALLELPEGFVLPPDIVPAPPWQENPDGREVRGNGLSDAELDGVGFIGKVVSRGVGHRRTILSSDDEAKVVEGCSGAAVQGERGVLGMVAERQQKRTGLFIPTLRLMKEEAIAKAWSRESATRLSFVEANAPKDRPLPVSVAGAQAAWLETPLGTRLDRYLHVCDREAVFELIEDATRATPGRRPAVAVFGSCDDDLPGRLYDRIQTEFLVQAGTFKEAEVARCPEQWPPEVMPWRVGGMPAPKALDRMKARLQGFLDAASPNPAHVRKKLGAGCSQAFYSEVSIEQLTAEDKELLRQWSAYLAEIGVKGLGRAVVHLLCIKAPFGAQMSAQEHADRVAELVAGAHPEIVVSVGLLETLSPDDLRRWLDRIRNHVPLDDAAAVRIRNLARQAVFAQPPRLGKLEAWLGELKE